MPFITKLSYRRHSLVQGAFPLLVALQLMSPAAATAADCPYTPAPGSAERKAIMDSLRKPVVKELGQRVVFVVSQLKVCRNWAFLEATPQRPDGQSVDWAVGVYANAVADDMCGGYIHALLVKKGGRWRVREHVICATDVPWVAWPENFGAPTALFPQF